MSIMLTDKAASEITAEQCEICPAAARVKAQSGSNVLYFCGHHGQANAEALASQGFNLFAVTPAKEA